MLMLRIKESLSLIKKAKEKRLKACTLLQKHLEKRPIWQGERRKISINK